MDYDEEKIAQDAVYHKSDNPVISGYFQDGFENPKDFPMIPEFHFRIQDPQQVLQLKKLYEASQPLSTGLNMPSMISEQFQNKMNSLLSSIDAAPLQTQQQMQCEINEPESESHGFYTMKDDEYDAQKALQAAYQHLQQENLNKKMSQLKISEVKFKPRPKNKAQEDTKKMQKQVIKKIRKMRIEEQYEL